MSNYLRGKIAFPDGTVAGSSIPAGPQKYILIADNNGLNGFSWDIDPIGPIGNTGPTGPTGPLGPYGDQGADGAPGVTGPTGPTGNVGNGGGFVPAITLNIAAGVLYFDNNTIFRISLGGPTASKIAFWNQIVVGGVMSGLPGTGSLPTGPNVVTKKFITSGFFVPQYWIEGTTAGTGGVQGNLTNVTQAAYFLPGSTGPVGDTGAKGDNGAVGDTGAAGPAGVVGDKGAAGSTGSNGITGATGQAGNDGPKGEQGDKGQKGTASQVEGPQGPQGLIGATGTAGNQGGNGDKGPTGPTGDKGAVGANGDPGEVGDKGGYVAPISLTITPPQYYISLGSGTFDIWVQRSNGTPSFWNGVIIGGVITSSGGSGSLPTGPNVVTNKYSQGGSGFFTDWYISGTTSGTGGSAGTWGTLTQAAYFIPGPIGPAGDKGPVGPNGQAGANDTSKGVIPFANNTARDAGTYTLGTFAFTLDAQQLWFANGGGWSKYPLPVKIQNTISFPTGAVSFDTVYLDIEGLQTTNINNSVTTLVIVKSAAVSAMFLPPQFRFNAPSNVVLNGSYFLCGRGGYAGTNTTGNPSYRYVAAGGGGGGGTTVGVSSGGQYPTKYATASWAGSTLYSISVANVNNTLNTSIGSKNGVLSVQNGGNGCPTQLQFTDGVYNLDGKPGACGGGAAWISSNATSLKGGIATQPIQGGNGFSSAIRGQPLAGLTAIGGGGGGSATTNGSAWAFNTATEGWRGGTALNFVAYYNAAGAPQIFQMAAGGQGQLNIQADSRQPQSCLYGRGGSYVQRGPTEEPNTPFAYDVLLPQNGVALIRFPTYRYQ